MAASDVRERAGAPAGAERGAGWPTRHRRPRVLDTVAVLTVVLPFVVVGVRYGITGHLVSGGDQALIELDLLDLRNMHQGVGLYSRMGWAHPGPAWLILLAPFYWLFGQDGSALVTASLAVHALMAALVVAAAGGGARWHRPLAAAVLLGYVLRMPAIDFVGVWNPFALLLPTALLVVVAARACAGSLPAGVATLVVGSYLVQTHVGTVPLVGLVGALVLAVLIIRARTRRLRGLDRAGRRAVFTLTGLLVLMWVPPVVQQLGSDGTGNLRMLAGDLLTGDPTAVSPTWSETVSTTGQQLGAAVFGWPAQPALVNAAVLTPAVISAVVVQLLGCAIIAILGLRTAARPAGWLAAVTGAATVAGLVSVHSITGLLLNYLVLWISVLPAMLLLAGIWLLGSWAVAPPSWLSVPSGFRRRPALLGVVVRLVAAVVAVVLGVGVASSLQRSTETMLGDQPGAAEAADAALGALPPVGDETRRVLLDIRDVEAWTTATRVALELERAGYAVTVADEWVYGFGADRRADGTEQWLVGLDPQDRGAGPIPNEVGLVEAQYGQLAIVVEPLG